VWPGSFAQRDESPRLGGSGRRRATSEGTVVFKPPMRLFTGAAVAAVAVAAALWPAITSAQTVELGATRSPLVAPTCPSNVQPSKCTIVLTRSTGLETIRDGVDYPTRAGQSGVIVAFTVGLSRLSANNATAKADIHYLDSTYGGNTEAAVAVLKPVGARRLFKWQLVAESPLFHLQPYLGTVTQFPLANSIGAPGTPAMAAPLPIAKGDVVALTVPTWAPVLSFGLSGKDFAYRQSRRANCTNPAASEQAQLTLNTIVQYRCDYTGTRIEYSATEITGPTPPANQIHGKRQKMRARRRRVHAVRRHGRRTHATRRAR
jgi:hypothetical protein